MKGRLKYRMLINRWRGRCTMCGGNVMLKRKTEMNDLLDYDIDVPDDDDFDIQECEDYEEVVE